MDPLSQRKARLIVNVMEHGTIVGTDDPITLEFEDCVGAVEGLVGWLAGVLAEVNEDTREQIGTAILVDALHHWTFDEQVDASEEAEDLMDEDDDET
jgi:hypothetical protein